MGQSVVPSISGVDKIKGVLLRPALTSNFYCQFAIPEKVKKFFAERQSSGYKIVSDENLSLLCSEASLPGSTLATVDIDNDFHGVSEKHAYRRLYDDRADFTFYVDRDYGIISLFENWISYIVGESGIERQQTPTYTYRINYPKLYKTDDLYITKFERDMNGKTWKYRFIGAYPISINSMPVSYDASNLLKCTVSFSYTRYVALPGTVSESILKAAGNTTPTDPNNVGGVDQGVFGNTQGFDANIA